MNSPWRSALGVIPPDHFENESNAPFCIIPHTVIRSFEEASIGVEPI
jgi:hypothetical protein